MLKRFLSGMAVAIGAMGAADAQAQSYFNTGKSRPAFVPSKPFRPAEVQQTAAKGVGAAPAPIVAPPVMAAPAPAPAQAPVQGNPYQLPPAIMNDINSACGVPSGDCGLTAEACGSSCSTLCGPPGRFWIGAEWLYWTAKGNYLPPLATSAAPGTPRPGAGALGRDGTGLLIGNQGVNDDWRNGLRLRGGVFLNQAQTIGVEGEFLFLGNSSQTLQAGSNGSNIVTRPIINNVVQDQVGGPFRAVPAFQDSELVSFPNTLAGTVTVNSTNQFIGGGVNGLLNLLCTPCARLDFLLGYRYLNLTDDLTIVENLRALPGNPRNGTTFVVQDRFRTENNFHGVNLGFNYERRMNRLFFGVRASVALGVNNSVVEIDGSTTSTTPAGVRRTSPGGLLTQPSNIGRYEDSSFAVVPEIGFRMGAQVTDHFRVFAGYNFLYWNNVTRTGEVIDLRVNGSQIPPRNIAQTGNLFPVYEPRKTDFWVHGVSVGAEFRY